MERLSYLLQNEAISEERFYHPLMQEMLQAFNGEALALTLDTSILWDFV